MTITTKRTKATSKKLLMYGAIAFAAAILLTATVSSGVLAQGANTASRNTTTGTTTTTTTPTSPSQANNLPNITGSIPLRTTISGALSSKVKTNLSDAIVIAQKSVGTNTSATLGLLRPLNGYLVYDIHVRNDANNTTYAVIVDPGTGKVLYKQALPSLLDGGMGHFGMFGPGKMGPFSGAYGGGNRGGFGEHGSMTIGPSPNMGPMGSVPPRAW
jgi:uncharacterized membrane protein YkoI